jgi:hypothetical protein
LKNSKTTLIFVDNMSRENSLKHLSPRSRSNLSGASRISIVDQNVDQNDEISNVNDGKDRSGIYRSFNGETWS